VEVVISLGQASFLPFIHFQHFFEFVMFPSISDIQPRRVSWGDISYTCSVTFFLLILNKHTIFLSLGKGSQDNDVPNTQMNPFYIYASNLTLVVSTTTSSTTCTIPKNDIL